MQLNIKTLTLYFISSLLILFSQFSLAAVSATVSSNKVAKGEIFVLKIVSDQRLDSDEIDFSILDNDFYLGRPSFGSALNFVNGKRSVRSEWTLSLAPLRAGLLEIPSFNVGKDSTQAISITSTVDPLTPSQDDLVTFQTQINKNQIYPGEVALLETRLIIKTDARRVQNPMLTPPGASGEIDITPVGEANQYQRIIDGVQATILDQSYSITAQQAGGFTIDGPRFSATIMDGSSRTGSTRLIPIETKQETIPLTVLAKPENFTGTWLPSPKLTLSQQWQDENANTIVGATEINGVVGAPITREITLAVEGVTQSQLPNISVDYPGSVRYYDEAAKFSQDGNTVTMTVKHVLIPKAEGKLTLPPITLRWWNTEKKQAETTKLAGLTLNVEKSDTPSIAIAPSQIQPPENKVVKNEVITVRDPGFWPYLTALFALLWLLSTVLWVRRTRHKTEVEREKPDTPPSFKALLDAIHAQDGIQARVKLEEWYRDNPQLERTHKEDIERKFSDMMAACYGKNSSDNNAEWDSRDLIAELKKINRVKKIRKNQDSGLSPL